jgi:2-polyprenyl-3-methyl-5-hydroxy-6-metoxy-1,4-benzoquinol methylase
MNDRIVSPLDGTRCAALVTSVPAASIVNSYQRNYQIDVSEYFKDIPQVRTYECSATGYRFFHPFSMAGNDSLYRHLGRFPWFYQEDKWEHAVALRYLRASGKVLDVGCGTGNFLVQALRHKNALVTGIELNGDSAQIAREKGLEVTSELIDAHARHRAGYYDAVCTFQVLEHIAEVGSFIENCLSVLAPGGIFVVGVPNNDGFLKFAPDAALNGPPHHMGLWTRESLMALTRLFPLELIGVEIEPLKEVDWYRRVMEQRYLPQRWMQSVYYRLGGSKIFQRYVEENASSIAGHTIMAVFRKTGQT